jgi:hypothetical protein
MGDLRRALFVAISATPDVLDLHAQVTNWLNIPNGLAGLPTIWKTLPEILETWTSPYGLPLPQSQVILEWVMATRRAERDARFIGRIPKPSYIQDELGGAHALKTPFFHGLMESNPLWIVLWHSSGTGGQAGPDVTRAKAYREIQGIYLAAHVRLASIGRTLENPDRWYQASLLLRILHQPYLGDDLDDWARQTRTVTTAYGFFSSFHAALERPETDIDRRRKQGYGALADIVNEAFDLGRPSVFEDRLDGQRSNRRKRGPGEYSNLDLIYDDHCYFWLFRNDPLSRLGETYGPVQISALSPGKELAKDLNDSGIDPAEFEEYIGYSVPAEELLDPEDMGSSTPGELPRLSTLYVAVNARHRYETMQAQRFVSRIGRVRPRTLARIIHVLEEAYAETEIAPDGASDEDRIELDLRRKTVQLLAISLVTGTPPAQVKEAAIIGELRELSRHSGLVYYPKGRAWYRPCLLPDRHPVSKTHRGVLVETQEWIVLSDVWSVGGEIWRGSGPQPMFMQPLEAYRRQFVKLRPIFLSPSIDPVFCTFETFGEAIKGWFDGREEGAQLRTAMMFGRRDPGAETHRYYTAYNLADIDQDYIVGMTELWGQMLGEKLPAERKLFNLRKCSSASWSSMYCGDDLVPARGTVRALMAELKKRLRAGVNFSHPEGLNLAMTYVGFVLALIIGFRHVRTPIPDLSLISRRTGFLSLHEKDILEAVHARPVYVPRTVRLQIDYFLGLLRYFWTVTDHSGRTEFRVKATKHRDKSRFNGGSFTLDQRSTLFYFEVQATTKQWQPSEMTGERLGQALDKIILGAWPVPNGGRHFVRTGLERLKCPATLINAHLGHSSLGESPWGPDSGFDPVHYRDAIAPFLDQILTKIDFEVIDFLAPSRG